MGRGCKKRPDGRTELSGVLLVIEVDEHMHKGYSVESEIVRLLEIKEFYKGPMFVTITSPFQDVVLRRQPAWRDNQKPNN
jgi:hypothetical protein